MGPFLVVFWVLEVGHSGVFLPKYAHGSGKDWEKRKFGSYTLHVQLGLGWDVFQNGWDGSQPLRRFVPPPPHHHHYLIFNTLNFLYQKGKSDIHWITTYNSICTFCHYFPKMVMQESKSFIPTVAKKFRLNSWVHFVKIDKWQFFENKCSLIIALFECHSWKSTKW